MTIRDKIEHSVIAALLLIAGILAGFPEAGAVAGMAVFVGREHAQAVYKLKKASGLGGMQPKLELEAFKFWQWRPDGQWDLYAPVATSAVGYLIYKGVS